MMSEEFEEFIIDNLKHNKQKITRVKNTNDVISFFKTIKKFPDKCPVWVKETFYDENLESNVNLENNLINIYNTLKLNNFIISLELI